MPKDFIWRGEEVIVEKSSLVNTLVDGLNQVFINGFNQTDLDKTILSEVFKPLPPTYISASNTKCSDNEFIGRDNELDSAGTYGYIYLIKAENINVISIPEEKGSYAITSRIDPSLIVGAMPSAFVAFALGINEKSFIKNPAYKEIFFCEKIKEVIGGEFSLIAPERLRNSDLPLSEVYKTYEMATQPCSSSTVANANVVSATFFQGQPQLPESPSADPNAQGSYQCRR